MKIKIIFCTTALVALVGCSDAKKSSEVTTAYVPTSAYTSMSCTNLRSEDLRLRRSVTEMSGAVDKEYSNDKTMEVVTWLLFWPAAFAMDGNDAEAAKLSQLKGEAEAIRNAMIQKNCRM